jgi:sec-independent protein translocase protein TatB
MDVGWSELLLIGIVALIVVGPKDLPRMFAALGRFTAKARSMAREFQRAMDDAARESGVAETAKDLRAMTSKQGLGLDKIEEAARKFESWDPVKAQRPGAKPAAAPGPETAKLAEKRAAEVEARRSAASAVVAKVPDAARHTAPAAAAAAQAREPAAPKPAAAKPAAAKPAVAKATAARPAPAKPAPATPAPAKPASAGPGAGAKPRAPRQAPRKAPDA